MQFAPLKVRDLSMWELNLDRRQIQLRFKVFASVPQERFPVFIKYGCSLAPHLIKPTIAITIRLSLLNELSGQSWPPEKLDVESIGAPMVIVKTPILPPNDHEIRPLSHVWPDLALCFA